MKHVYYFTRPKIGGKVEKLQPMGANNRYGYVVCSNWFMYFFDEDDLVPLQDKLCEQWRNPWTLC